MVAKADHDRLDDLTYRWRTKAVRPMQYLINLMSMIPKKGKAGDVRCIAAMASGWRTERKVDANSERQWATA